MWTLHSDGTPQSDGHRLSQSCFGRLLLLLACSQPLNLIPTRQSVTLSVTDSHFSNRATEQHFNIKKVETC
jgi:hypothetical protein